MTRSYRTTCSTLGNRSFRDYLVNLLQLLMALRAHYKVAFAVFLVTMATGIAISLLLPKRYVATTDLVFDVKTPDPIAGVMLPIVPGYMATQVDIIKSDRVALAVIKLLRLDQSPVVQQQWMDATGGKGKIESWFSDILRRGLQVTPAQGSSIMSISYTAGDPSFAASVANAFAQVYIDANIELRIEPARQYSRWFGEQGKAMREALEKAQARLSEFQRNKGIVAKDERLDIEMSKLNEMSSQLTALQAQTSEANIKQRSGENTLPEVMQNSLIQGLKSDIARQEARLQEAAGNLGKNHPQYQRMESELAAMKKQLQAETRFVTGSLATTSKVGQDRETNLKNAIAAQKRKILELRGDYDQLAVLQRDVDAAQNAYQGVTQRYNQTSLESQITQANVSVLNSASEPSAPSSPNIPRNILISVLAGVFLGAGFAVLLEMLDRRVRSVNDLSAMLSVPVLGSIGHPKSPGRLLTYLHTRVALLSR